MNKRLFAWTSAPLLLLSGLQCPSYATTPAELPFVKALIEGKASGELPAMPMFIEGAQLIKDKTGSNGDVTVQAFRILKFKSQAKCGRIAFGLYQESTNTLFGQLGGQLNICEDGSPPQRLCLNGKKKVLVPAESTCADGTKPMDDPEVADSIATAIRNGGLSVDEMKKRIAESRPKTKNDDKVSK